MPWDQASPLRPISAQKQDNKVERQTWAIYKTNTEKPYGPVQTCSWACPLKKPEQELDARSYCGELCWPLKGCPTCQSPWGWPVSQVHTMRSASSVGVL